MEFGGAGKQRRHTPQPEPLSIWLVAEPMHTMLFSTNATLNAGCAESVRVQKLLETQTPGGLPPS